MIDAKRLTFVSLFVIIEVEKAYLKGDYAK